MSEQRKADHIELAKNSQVKAESLSGLFNYEPLFHAHPPKDAKIETSIFGKKLNYPLWISSMTGGAKSAQLINKNLATVASQYKIGMGLGSCRSILDSDNRFEDFNLRPILGTDVPFYANLGIAQLEELVEKKSIDKIHHLIDRLSADGLIIHVNPLQEWFQPEGDRYKKAPIETIEAILKNKKYPVIVKEVGQGFGPRSLRALIELKVDGIELAGFGGTNFSKLEALRKSQDGIVSSKSALINVGHTPDEMVDILNSIYTINSSTSIIISGGIKDVVHGMALKQRLKFNSVIGFGLRFLEHAEDLNKLNKFIIDEIETLQMTNSFLEIKS